jgi:hypothetical protein
MRNWKRRLILLFRRRSPQPPNCNKHEMASYKGRHRKENK